MSQNPCSTLLTIPTPQHRFAILYESPETERRARNACRHLAQTVAGERLYEQESWKFEMLQQPSMRDMALVDAAGARLLVLAPQDAGVLPRELLAFVQAAFGHPVNRPASIVILLSRTAEAPTELVPVVAQLSKLAGRLRARLHVLHANPSSDIGADPDYDAVEVHALARLLNRGAAAS